MSNIIKELMRGNSDDDLEDVTLCQEGDVDAFEAIVRRHQKRMFNLSYRIVGDYNDAAEVVQDAFISAYRNIRSFRGKSKFSTWLYSIVINLSRNRLKQVRSRAHREPVSTDDPVHANEGETKVEYPANDLSVLERLEKKEVEQKVQGCINALGTEFREVIVLRDIQDFSYEEIAVMLDIAAGTVKSRLYRARESVRDCLKKYAGEF